MGTLIYNHSYLCVCVCVFARERAFFSEDPYTVSGLEQEFEKD